MSEHSETVVRLDPLDPNSVDDLVTGLLRELVDDGILIGNTRRDELWSPSEWLAGPCWQLATDERDASWRGLANNGVGVSHSVEVHHPVENLEPPCCPVCGTTLDGGRYDELLEVWLGDGEPSVGCSVCGTHALLGDWPAPWGYAVGAPAVCFNNWPPLSRAFIDRLRASLAGRTFVVRAHF